MICKKSINWNNNILINRKYLSFSFINAILKTVESIVWFLKWLCLYYHIWRISTTLILWKPSACLLSRSLVLLSHLILSFTCHLFCTRLLLVTFFCWCDQIPGKSDLQEGFVLAPNLAGWGPSQWGKAWQQACEGTGHYDWGRQLTLSSLHLWMKAWHLGLWRRCCPPSPLPRVLQISAWTLAPLHYIFLLSTSPGMFGWYFTKLSGVLVHQC